MRTILPILLLALAACSTTEYMRDARPTSPPGPREAKVVFYRTSPIGQDAHFPVYEMTDDGGKLLGFTETDCYFEVLCPPGVHLFLTWSEGDEFVEADLEPGKTYFLRAYSKFGIVRPRPGLDPVTPGTDRWKELLEVGPTLQCRRLDPLEAAEFTARNRDRMLEAHRAYVEGRKAPRILKPDDGSGNSILPSK